MGFSCTDAFDRLYAALVGTKTDEQRLEIILTHLVEFVQQDLEAETFEDLEHVSKFLAVATEFTAVSLMVAFSLRGPGWEAHARSLVNNHIRSVRAFSKYQE